MAHALRQDIPSRRARTVLTQMAPNMADLNPAPRAGGVGPPPPVNLDPAPAGSFQANRALNGERGVAARQRARMRHRNSGVSSSSRGSARVSPQFGWETDAFPADSDIFGAPTAGPDETELPQFQSPGVASHSARFRRDSGLEGGGTGVSRGRGPVPPSSPDSVALFGTFGALGVCWDGWCPRCCVPQGQLVPVSVSLGLLVPAVIVFIGTVGAHVWFLGLLVPTFVFWDYSDFSEWGGIEGEVRIHASPALGPPIELRSTRVVSAPQLPALVAEPAASREVEQFRAASRSQSRQEVLASVESPGHEKVARTRFAAVPSPRRVASQEDGGRAAVRYSGHLRRRSKSADPMDVEPVSGGRSRSLAFPDPRTARFLDADPVGMLTTVNPVVVKVLADGWQEPIPLGHFARRFNPLMSGYSSGELSTLRMGENGQVQVHHCRLREIPLDELTETDWYQIKRNFPQAIREYLVPPGQKYAGSEVARATADMVKALFTLMEERDRFSKEITPIFHYVDHKIRWWHAHSLDNIRIDTMDDKTFESIYREWRECEDEREKEKERLRAQEKRGPGLPRSSVWRGEL
ncbi:hypothetical protein EV360DRAFT_70011 [Lentinula raphanica]|nr:hypothetical protein EV360DRAFT_70011 [Lentinula raphanica]